MTIKEFAYSTQQHLQTTTKGSFKRAHIYELLAAAFGFNSYAALCTKSVFTNVALTEQLSTKHQTLICNRCVELGYPVDLAEAVSITLKDYLDESEIGVFAIDGLVALLRTEWDDNWDIADDESDIDPEDLDDIVESRQALTDAMLESPLLLEGLESVAIKGNALSHYALALIQRFSDDGEEPEPGSEYWYLEAKAGRFVTGVEKEWADSYEAYLAKSQKYVHHLRAAAMLGEPNALLDLADKFNEPTFFELGMDRVFSSPAYVAEIAERLDRPADAKRWLTIAAESGDTDAMRQLIEVYDKGDLVRCWTWIYLAQLLGSDLAQDSHYAINEDGSDYDDDVGGPAFVGGHDGVRLETLSVAQDEAAKKRAQDIYDSIQR
jgi:TPR repeat protein